MDRIHITLDGRILDPNGLSDRQFAFYTECLSAYKSNMPRADFLRLMQAHDNPLMNGSRFITKEIMSSPLYELVEDIEQRLAIRQGKMAPNPGDNPDQEPAQRENFLSANEAAKRTGVSVTAIIKAVKNGRLAGHQEKARGQWKISARSLAQYGPSR